MSGASALAAAKRRRGISSQPPPRPTSSRGPPPRPSPNGPPSGVPSPMQLLENHHGRLKIIESNIENMVGTINT